MLAQSYKLCAFLVLIVGLCLACGGNTKTERPEEETLSRTEFTDRVENFFEYSPLKAGKPSDFLIHLTDLSDGSPVENADVTLVIRRADNSPTTQIKAKVGRVTGIYVAEVLLTDPGKYNVEFQIKNEKLDERMPLTDFEVE